MKRNMIWLLAAALIFSGCAAAQDDPFRVDTVVQIPVDPTEVPTEPETEAPIEAATEAPTEEPTEAPTEPEETTAKKTTASATSSSSQKSSTSSSKSSTSSSKNSSSEKTRTTATQPPVTEPPATAAPETIPVETVSPTEPPYDPSSYGIGGLEYALLDKLNAYRAEAGVAGMSISGKLSGIAYLRAQEASSSWSHTRPDGRGYTSAMSDHGYGYGTSAELMVYVSGSGDAASIAAKWMSSDSHSANILSGSFSTVGIGAYCSGGMTYVVCLLVG